MHFRIFLICSVLNFYACVSSSRFHSVTAERDQLSFQLQENKFNKDSLEILAKELESTKLQLQKTENVLIEFYLKHNSGPEKKDSSSSSNPLENEQTQSTIQESQVIEMKQLNDQLVKSKLDYEQLNAKYEKLVQAKEPKKSTAKKLDSLNKEIVFLKNSLAKEKANLVLQGKEMMATNELIDSLKSQVQFGELRIKQLQIELREIKSESESLKATTNFDQKIRENELQTEINQVKANQEELNRLNAQMLEAIQKKDQELDKLKDSNAALNLELERIQKTLASSNVKEKESQKETEIKALQEELKQNEKTTAALNEIIDEKNLQIQKQQQLLLEKDAKLNATTEELNKSSTHSMRFVQSDSIRMQQERKLTILESQNQDLRDGLKSNEHQREQLEQKVNQLKSELESALGLKDSLQLKQKELLQLKKSHVEELKIAISRLESKQASLDSLNAKFKALQNSNTQVEIRTVDPNVTAKNEKESNLPIEVKNSKQQTQFPDKEPQAIPKINPSSNNKRIGESVKKQLRNLVESNPIIGFETSSTPERDLILIPWNALFDKESFAIKESGASLMEAFSNILKQNRKLKISFVKGGLNQSGANTNDKRMNTLKKLMQVYGVSAFQISEGFQNEDDKQQHSDANRIVISVYTD
ncbi:MAG TPA: hypothetical protein PLS73_11205 [Saprospiraceae bacterium]|nr:hypothetical protein [Saprospiraceae bacterium]